jgi:hypothetical protein
MKSLDIFVRNNNYKQKRQRNNSIKGTAVLAVVGVAIGGTVLGLLYQKCCSEIRQIVFKNVKDFNEEIDIEKDIDIDFYDEVNEEIDTKREEIKQVLKKKINKPMGDVGNAIEEALEDLEI